MIEAVRLQIKETPYCILFIDRQEIVLWMGDLVLIRFPRISTQ